MTNIQRLHVALSYNYPCVPEQMSVVQCSNNVPALKYFVSIHQ